MDGQERTILSQLLNGRNMINDSGKCVVCGSWGTAWNPLRVFEDSDGSEYVLCKYCAQAGLWLKNHRKG